jgi:hypothetical protein
MSANTTVFGRYKLRRRFFIERRGSWPVELKEDELLLNSTGTVLCAPGEDFVFIAKSPGYYLVVELIPPAHLDTDKPEFGL